MYLGLYALFQSFHVTDDAYLLAAHLVQFFQCVHNGVQVVAAQCAETFVDEQCVYREALAAEGRKSEGSDRDTRKLSPPDKVHAGRAAPP